MLLVTVLASFCLLAAIVTFGLGIYVIARNPVPAANRLFFAAMLAAAVWAFGEFMIWQPAGYESARFWLRVSAIWPLSVAFILHFIMAFTGHPGARDKNLGYLALLLYLPALAFILLGLFTGQLYRVAYLPGIGYGYTPVSGSAASLANAAFIVAVMVYAVAVGFSAWLRKSGENLGRQNLLVTLSMIVVIVSGALSGLVLPSLGVFLPNLVFIGIVFFAVIIAYAIVRYHLFTLSPETAVTEIIRTMPDGLILADMNGRIVSGNMAAAAIAGVYNRDITEMTVMEIITEKAFAALRTAVLTRGLVADIEADLAGDRHTVVSIAGSLVLDPAGNAAGIVLIIHDITRRKAQEKALRVAGEQVSLLNQLTRHDISNMITALGSYLALLSREHAGDPDFDLYHAKCRELIEKIAGHLRFSREYQEIGVHAPSFQSLSGLVSRALRDLDRGALRIVTDVGPQEIFADPLSYRVIYNLIENAVRHGGKAKEAVIASAVCNDGSLSVVVRDDGVGVKPEEKELIFQRGYGRNTGLGLTLSRGILAVTGITIAENGTFGEGARFEIRVPPTAWREIPFERRTPP